MIRGKRQPLCRVCMRTCQSWDRPCAKCGGKQQDERERSLRDLGGDERFRRLRAAWLEKDGGV